MKRRRLYITISIIIIALAVALLSWAIFVGRQQQKLQQNTSDLGYFSGARGEGSGRDGIFGGVFGGEEKDVADPSKPEPALRQLYNLPTSGYVKKRANAIRFVDRATGHVFEKDLPDGTTTRVDQTTIPQVYNAVFTEDGDGVIRQYVDEIGNIVSVYSLIADGETTSTQLPANILDIKSRQNEDRLAILYRTPEGSTISITSSKGVVDKSILDSNLRGWTLDWESNKLLVTQKPSGSLPGSSYLFDIISGVRTTVLRQVPGLETNLSPSGESILYSKIQQEGTPVLVVRNVTTGVDMPLNIAGFANKCVWLPTGAEAYCALPLSFPQAQYPDAWYQGDVHFTDSLWKVNVETGLVEHVFSPAADNGVSLDMTKLAMSADGNTLFFINNTDQTLWSVTFPEIEEGGSTTEKAAE